MGALADSVDETLQGMDDVIHYPLPLNVPVSLYIS